VGVVERSRNALLEVFRVGACVAARAGVGDDADEFMAVKTPPAAPRTARTATSA
jgi:hypothetical protein